jgi:hypothetical protein
LIARWREQKRKDQAPVPISAQSPGGSKQVPKDWEEGSSKRRKLTRRIVSSDTSVRPSAQDTIRSESPQAPTTRKRQSRLVILSSPSTEIQETQQQSLSTTDSIQVNVPQANHIDREEYQTIPNSSASLELPSSNNVSNASTKDQEADSALGLSSPIDDGFTRASASFIDQEEQEPRETRGSRLKLSSSEIPTSSTQSVESQRLREDQRTTSRQATSSLQTSGPIEATPNSIQLSEGGEPVRSATDTAASSPLFYPDPREELREQSTDAVRSLTPSQELAQSQLVDTSAQQPDLGTITSQTTNDLLPISAARGQGQNASTQRSEPPFFATPSPVVRRPNIRRSASQNRSATTRELGTNIRYSPQSLRELTDFLKQPPGSPPVRQLPRAKLFQRLNLSSSPSQPAGSLSKMSARSRECSPRVGQSAPPVERSASSPTLRETLIKQTAPARALQQARHERAANRSTSRATSTATDSTRNSIPARTANTSPMRPQTNMTSILVSDQGFSASGAFSSSMQVDESEPALVSSIAPAISVYNSALGSSALPLHPSIEDEQSLPRGTRPSLPSSPILGPGEYVVPLPAEGKIKDHYLECIRGKRRALMKFTRNPKSTGRANMSRINVCFRWVDLVIEDANICRQKKRNR